MLHPCAVFNLLVYSAIIFLFHSYSVHNHFIRLLEKVHRPPQNPKPIRVQVVVKGSPCIPFLNKMEFVLILHVLAKVAAPASLLGSQGADQGYDRLA